MSPKAVMCVIGTRPEAIKMAPVISALKAESCLSIHVLLSGQHQDLLHQALAVFDIGGDFDLAVMRENQTLSALTARLLSALDAVFDKVKPALVIAQGDTTTVMATAMTAFYRDVPFAHVEAGLRTSNLRSPFPEEFNRIVADRIATLNFAPTQTARAALLAEGVPKNTIHVTGNTIIDALFSVAKRIDALPFAIEPNRRLVLMTMHRRENFGEPIQQIIRAIQILIDRFVDLEIVYPVHPNPNVLPVVKAALGNHPRIRLIEPLDYPSFVSVLKRATLVLTDSGGLQEEAPALAKPVLVMRRETERPEAVESGVAKLIGTATENIVTEVSRLLTDASAYKAMARGISPYGDGHAAERIRGLVIQHLFG